MRRPKCDLKGGWPECWNTECRWHGKAAKRWHELDFIQLKHGSNDALETERKALYEKLTVEPAPRKRVSPQAGNEK